MSEAGGDNEAPEHEQALDGMWQESLEAIQQIDSQTENWKIQALPLARIKKIMKSEDFAMQELEKQRRLKDGEAVEGEGAKPIDKFMIAGEAPLVMTKACELMIKELSLRAWKHTDNNRRKTLQRADVHAAVGESEIFDFLIDMVPRVASNSMGLVTIPPANPNAVQDSSQPQPSTNSDQVLQHQQEEPAAIDLSQLQQLYLPVNNPTEGGGEDTENGDGSAHQQQQDWGGGSAESPG